MDWPSLAYFFMHTNKRMRLRLRLRLPGLRHYRETYLRPSLLGAVDGLITSFVIVAGGLASQTPRKNIVLIGFSSLVADGISMGVSEAISSRAQDQLRWCQAFIRGLACFVSFIVFGCAPLVGYTVGSTDEVGRYVSIVVFVVMLFSVGALRAAITQEQCVWAIGEVVTLGAAAGGVAYAIASIRV